MEREAGSIAAWPRQHSFGVARGAAGPGRQRCRCWPPSRWAEWGNPGQGPRWDEGQLGALPSAPSPPGARPPTSGDPPARCRGWVPRCWPSACPAAFSQGAETAKLWPGQDGGAAAEGGGQPCRPGNSAREQRAGVPPTLYAWGSSSPASQSASPPVTMGGSDGPPARGRPLPCFYERGDEEHTDLGKAGRLWIRRVPQSGHVQTAGRQQKLLVHHCRGTFTTTAPAGRCWHGGHRLQPPNRRLHPRQGAPMGPRHEGAPEERAREAAQVVS